LLNPWTVCSFVTPAGLIRLQGEASFVV
jgi:hypothetical protein